MNLVLWPRVRSMNSTRRSSRRVTIAPIARSGNRMIRTIRLASAFLDANSRLSTMVGEDDHRPEDVADLATDRPTRTVPVQPLRPQHEWPQHRVGRDGDHRIGEREREHVERTNRSRSGPRSPRPGARPRSRRRRWRGARGMRFRSVGSSIRLLRDRQVLCVTGHADSSRLASRTRRVTVLILRPMLSWRRLERTDDRTSRSHPGQRVAGAGRASCRSSFPGSVRPIRAGAWPPRSSRSPSGPAHRHDRGPVAGRDPVLRRSAHRPVVRDRRPCGHRGTRPVAPRLDRSRRPDGTAARDPAAATRGGRRPGAWPGGRDPAWGRVVLRVVVLRRGQADLPDEHGRGHGDTVPGSERCSLARLRRPMTRDSRHRPPPCRPRPPIE